MAMYIFGMLGMLALGLFFEMIRPGISSRLYDRFIKKIEGTKKGVEK